MESSLWQVPPRDRRDLLTIFLPGLLILGGLYWGGLLAPVRQHLEHSSGYLMYVGYAAFGLVAVYVLGTLNDVLAPRIMDAVARNRRTRWLFLLNNAYRSLRRRTGYSVAIEDSIYTQKPGDLATRCEDAIEECFGPGVVDTANRGVNGDRSRWNPLAEELPVLLSLLRQNLPQSARVELERLEVGHHYLLLLSTALPVAILCAAPSIGWLALISLPVYAVLQSEAFFAEIHLDDAAYVAFYTWWVVRRQSARGVAASPPLPSARPATFFPPPSRQSPAEPAPEVRNDMNREDCP